MNVCDLPNLVFYLETHTLIYTNKEKTGHATPISWNKVSIAWIHLFIKIEIKIPSFYNIKVVVLSLEEWI